MKNRFNTYLAMLFALASIAMLPTSQGAIDEKKNGEWATITGKVTNVKPDSFTLKAGGSNVLIEMDDYDLAAEGYTLRNGDQVVVNGRVDKDFLENKKIEAASVYVKGMDTYFYASSADEEFTPIISTSYLLVPTLPEGATVDIKGTVEKINGKEMTVDTGLRTVTVDTSSLKYNPLDKKGLVKIKVGDVIRASGTIEDDFFDAKEVAAKFVLKY